MIGNQTQPLAKLLAKSQRAGKPPLTLEEHSFDTAKAASLIFNLEKQ